MVDWLELPDDVLSLVANKLHLHVDFIRFGAVCHSWNSVYTDLRRNRRNSHSLPFLMLATESNSGDTQTRSLYSLTNKQVSNYKVQVPHDRFCRGSSHGWLVTVRENKQISLVNPFSPFSNEIHLPPLSELKCDQHPRHDSHVGYLCKAVLSANPSYNPNYVVIAIYCACNRVAFYRPGDDTWTCVDLKRSIADAIYYRDRFYFLGERGALFSYNLDLPHPMPPKQLSVAPPLDCLTRSRYLVDSSGDLLQVIRDTLYESSDDEEETENEDDIKHFMYFNGGFYVYKLDLLAHKWIQLRNLNGCILFLGDNYSLCLKASDFPECKTDSVYFTDDYYDGYSTMGKYGIGPHDMGVYSLEHGTLETHYPTDSKMIYPAPIWIEPPL